MFFGKTKREVKKELASMTNEDIIEIIRNKPTVKGLLAKGIDARQLEARGFTAGDLLNSGFTQKEINEAYQR